MPKALPVLDISAPICCAPVSAAPMNTDAALQLALRLKALANPTWIQLMSILLTTGDGEVCTCDLAAAVDLAESTVSHHLGQLRKAGMVESTRRGMNVYHRARTEALDALRVVLDPDCCSRGKRSPGKAGRARTSAAPRTDRPTRTRRHGPSHDARRAVRSQHTGYAQGEVPPAS